MLDRALDWIAQTLLVLAALLAFVLCFIVVADVIGRVVFNRPLKGTPEIVSFSIVVICYLQAAYAIRSGGMINVDAFTIHLPAACAVPAGGVRLRCSASLLFALICWGSIDGAAHAWTLGRVRGRGRAARPGLAGALRHRRRHARWRRSSYVLLLLRQLDAFRRGAPPVTSSASH